MDGNDEGVTPTAFLSSLRRLVPQFNEMAQESKVGFGMRGFAQQGSIIFVFLINALADRVFLVL
jgi:hypothetical protein